ncbi:MAG: hypothetical protein J5640_01630 [Bacteroidales bacterium]|nr:hypothetical protein [Bacteroidales bacterium]
MKRLIAVIGLSLMLIPALAQNHTDYTLPEKPKRAEYIDFASLDKGLWFAVQLTPALAYTSEGSGTFCQADLIAGYRFGEFFKLGLGIAPRLVSMPESVAFRMAAKPVSSVVLPLFLDIRGNIISQESRMCVPYWNLDAGYTFGQGFYASPTVGVRVGRPRNNFIAGVTYMFQHIQGDPGIPAHVIGLRLGFEY